MLCVPCIGALLGDDSGIDDGNGVTRHAGPRGGSRRIEDRLIAATTNLKLLDKRIDKQISKRRIDVAKSKRHIRAAMTQLDWPNAVEYANHAAVMMSQNANDLKFKHRVGYMVGKLQSYVDKANMTRDMFNVVCELDRDFGATGTPSIGSIIAKFEEIDGKANGGVDDLADGTDIVDQDSTPCSTAKQLIETASQELRMDIKQVMEAFPQCNFTDDDILTKLPTPPQTDPGDVGQ